MFHICCSRRCWDNLKTKTKQSLTAAHAHQMGTGGGPPLLPRRDPILDRVQQIVPYIALEVSTVIIVVIYSYLLI